MDESTGPQTPTKPQVVGQHASPVFGTPSSVGANEDNMHYVAPDRKVGVNQFANNEQFSDITIHYGPGGRSTFKAHKVILASLSLWFQAAFSNPMFIESNASDITLHDDEELPTTIMLRSCYYPPVNAYEIVPPWNAAEKKAKHFTNQALLFHVGVYVVADKYMLPQLQHRAAHHVGRYLKEYPDAVLRTQDNNRAAVIGYTNLPGCLKKIYDVAVTGDDNNPLKQRSKDEEFLRSVTLAATNYDVLVDYIHR